MSLQIYNTLTRKKEPFEPLKEGRVSLYVCGPTVYDKAHVGHAMSSLVFDIVRRYLEYRGYEVKHVMNYTDVDDKIIQRANHEQVEPLKVAERYIHEYDDHIRELNILPAAVYPRVSEEIDQIVKLIQELGEADYAYEADGEVYFRVQKDEDYGRLSRRKLEDMQAGSRVDVDGRKEHPMDFALWKAAKPGEPSWESPWGKGRPGWHIECSAMSVHHLGEQIDIHGGGNDLIFPHHENEIAQTESFTGKPFSKYWMHNGMMQLSGEKMSKSLGNLVTVEDFLKEHEADVLRVMVLNSGYRSPLTYSDEVVEQSKNALDRLHSGLRPAFANAEGAAKKTREVLAGQVAATREGFLAAMDDDFNSAGALGHVFDLVRAINQARDAMATDEDLARAQSLLLDLTDVFGLQLQKRSSKHDAGEGQVAPFIDLLLEIREGLREAKQWELADRVRDRLSALGVVIEDGKDGVTSWRWK